MYRKEMNARAPCGRSGSFPGSALGNPGRRSRGAFHFRHGLLVGSLFLSGARGLSQTTANGAKTAASAASPAYNAVVKTAQVPGLERGMDYVKLGDSDLVVSKVCMGTMNFGEQNTLQEGVEQITRAFDHFGVNMIDTAEMYSVPTRRETQGLTDRSVGMFLKGTGKKREEIVLATKVCGRSERFTWMPRRVEGTATAVTPDQIVDSVEASLQRLGTDYIDLLQIHWPDRYVGSLFGMPDFTPSAYESSPPPVGFAEQLEGLQKVIQQGKVRYVGVSNETPYGLMSFVQLAEQFPDLYPKVVSIQNSYSLCVRKDFEAGLAEACYHHNVGLLAYSPLAAGTLTGKYRGGNPPKGSRLLQFPGFMDRYLGSQNERAVNAYCDLAAEAGLTPAQLALSWCYHHSEHVASTIIGATSLDQLEENLKSYDVRLTDETLEGIADIYRQYTDPTKARGPVRLSSQKKA